MPSSFPSPLQSTNLLSNLDSFDLTPSIGTELSSSTQLSSLLTQPGAVKDLAILVSQRGVVFFRDQVLSTKEQLQLVTVLGEESGKPKESGLHVHPTTEETSELGSEVRTIKPDLDKVRYYGLERPRAAKAWHSDISFEPFPSAYAILKLNHIPETGGDTVWASAHEAYDRLSPALQAFLETLTATHVGEPFFAPGRVFRSPRGHPENVGQDLKAVHPLIRTNPVTGWRGLYVNRVFTKRINELSLDESDHLLSYLFEHVSQNHDLQVRFKWQIGSIAIWDNRSTFHCVTQDYGSFPREGERVISLGERPYFDPASGSRRESLRA
ncbi:taurine catabolism dioxygenase [Mrakia frigida]|uniref:TauD/TfdA dioxygenase family protein n=1 Tax=Mrakia frigida TaxID=29902 RepID=UPI003FCC244E